jgi:hypothetical protein
MKKVHLDEALKLNSVEDKMSGSTKCMPYSMRRKNDGSDEYSAIAADCIELC